MERNHEGEGLEHYKNHGSTEVIILMEQVGKQVFHAGFDELDHDMVGSETYNKQLDTIVESAVNASYGMKHLARVGTKEIASVEQELLKAENYIHRARTGEWINK